MKKRMIWCLLASLIVVSVLVAGCSKGGSTTTSPPASSPSASTQSQPSASQSLADLLAKAEHGNPVTLDFTVTTSAGKTVSGTMWKQNGMLKMETTANGHQAVMIISYTDNTMIEYQPGSSTGVKMKLPSTSQDATRYLEGVDASTVQDLGTAVINGETCRVVQYAMANSPTTTIKMWISEDQGIPVQLISTNANGLTTTMDYTNIKVGPLPGDTFSVPAGITIRDMTNINLPSQP
jgi:outer membrane lipoprotein-sorting protein